MTAEAAVAVVGAVRAWVEVAIRNRLARRRRAAASCRCGRMTAPFPEEQKLRRSAAHEGGKLTGNCEGAFPVNHGLHLPAHPRIITGAWRAGRTHMTEVNASPNCAAAFPAVNGWVADAVSVVGLVRPDSCVDISAQSSDLIGMSAGMVHRASDNDTHWPLR